MDYATFKQNSIAVETILLDICAVVKEDVLAIMDYGLSIADNTGGESPEALRDKAIKYFKRRTETEDRVMHENKDMSLKLSQYALAQSIEGGAVHGEQLEEECPGLADRIMNLVQTFQQLNVDVMNHPLSGRTSEIAKYL